MNYFRGVVPGIVKSLEDPDGLGRIRVHFPRLPGENRSFWASVAAPMAGNGRGFFFHPEQEDEVLVAFDEGDPQHPYIVGYLWNGVDLPPLDGINASVRRLRTVSGHTVDFDDRPGQERILVKTQAGQEIEMKDLPAASVTIRTVGGQKVTLNDGPPTVAVTIEITGGNQITIDPTGIRISAPSGILNINCLTANVVASSLLNVTAPITVFSGVLQVPTLMAQAVVSAAYTPAPGNRFGL